MVHISSWDICDSLDVMSVYRTVGWSTPDPPVLCVLLLLLPSIETSSRSESTFKSNQHFFSLQLEEWHSSIDWCRNSSFVLWGFFEMDILFLLKAFLLSQRFKKSFQFVFFPSIYPAFLLDVEIRTSWIILAKIYSKRMSFLFSESQGSVYKMGGNNKFNIQWRGRTVGSVNPLSTQ